MHEQSNSQQTSRKVVVKFDNIVKSYRKGKLSVPVIKGIDMEIHEGEFVGIMGSSGSGKSTLLNILGLLDIPTDGRYFLDEQEVEHLDDDRLAELRNARIGFIFQGFNLSPHLTVEQNIEVPMVYAGLSRHKRKQRAKELATQVNLSHRLGHKPTQLSGGECQRIAIARSLANAPSFLLADEPTGNLDEKTSADIMKLFHDLHQSKSTTIVMVTHNPDYEGHFDRIIRLRDGKIADHGHMIADRCLQPQG